MDLKGLFIKTCLIIITIQLPSIGMTFTAVSDRSLTQLNTFLVKEISTLVGYTPYYHSRSNHICNRLEINLGPFAIGNPLEQLRTNILNITLNDLMPVWRSCEIDLNEDPNCKIVTDILFKYLDISPFVYPVFKREFNKLMASEELREVLSNLDSELSKLDLDKGKTFNVWDWPLVQPQIGGDKEKGIKWMAVLFQDTLYHRHLIGYINYFTNRSSKKKLENVSRKLIELCGDNQLRVDKHR